MWWFQSPRIVFGEDALGAFKDLKGRRALVVTDKKIRGLRFFPTVSKCLSEAESKVEVFDEVESEPSIQNVEEGVRHAMEFSPDWIIGLGSGSCIDAAEARAFYDTLRPLWWTFFLSLSSGFLPTALQCLSNELRSPLYSMSVAFPPTLQRPANSAVTLKVSVLPLPPIRISG